MALSFNEAAKKINNKYPYLTLVKFIGTKKKATFLDNCYPNEFEAIYKNVLLGNANHPERSKLNKTQTHVQTFEEAKRKIEDKFPYLTLLTYNNSKMDSEFIDKEFGPFKRPYHNVFAGKSGHSNRRIFNLRKSLKLQSVKNKRIETVRTLYNVDNVFQLPEIKEKSKQSRLAKYGTEHRLQNKDEYKKYVIFMLNTYGSDNPMKITQFKENQQKAILQNYGVKYPSQNLEIMSKIKQTCIERGHYNNIDGLSAVDYHANYVNGIAYSTFIKNKNRSGLEFAKNHKTNKTAIEQIIQNHLTNLNIIFEYNKYIKRNDKENSSYKPDFLIENSKLLIECDGLYYHSDAIKRNNYHKNKLNFYNSIGYKALFFREDEIFNKLDIVKSIINSHLGLNNKIFARKCIIEKLTTKESILFFEQNHLMGKGSGTTYCLKHNNEIVCAIRVVNKKDYLDVSRFCSILNTTVIGGLSKLLKHVIKESSPKKIISFVDMRYGDGHSLIKNNFKEVSNHISFKWTNCEKTFHRLVFKKNSGYEKGFYKIWDCGQKKFELIL